KRKTIITGQGALMMPLSPQLQQHWQTVADRLPTDFPVAELSPQARSVMAFSDFVEQSVIAQPGWLNELADSAPAAEEWRWSASPGRRRCRW
ncbi:hypothetical protein, partial [Pseudomonas aeruginosa]|uniref:hypothetical protein n=1 Tax=Pseudomonas aeruginosa TaxID=287 RepID=UPI001ED99B1D